MDEKDLARFMSHVEKRESGCWEWTANRDQKGCGRLKLRVNGKFVTYRAHRASYEHFNGGATGIYVCHECDNPTPRRRGESIKEAPKFHGHARLHIASEATR